MVFVARNGLHHLAGVVGAVPEVNDLHAIAKIQVPHILQVDGPIKEQDHFLDLAQAVPDGLLSQQGTEVL